MRVVDKEIQYFLSLFHHVFFSFFYVLYNIIRSDRVYWGLIGWKWCHLLKFRPRSRSFFVVFKYREEGRSKGEVERWMAAAAMQVGDTDSVSSSSVTPSV